MSIRPHIHVIDPDVRRRAQIARDLTSRNLHAEIYEDLAEFQAGLPTEGIILIADCGADSNPGALRSILDAEKKPLAFAAYSDEIQPQRIVLAMLAGGADYLRWPFEAPLLTAALLRLVSTGEHRAQEQRREIAARTAIAQLTEREREVLELLMIGDSNKDVGRKLEISPRTVEIHRGNMLRKLHARTPSAAVCTALLAGLDGWQGGDDRMAA